MSFERSVTKCEFLEWVGAEYGKELQEIAERIIADRDSWNPEGILAECHAILHRAEMDEAALLNASRFASSRDWA